MITDGSSIKIAETQFTKIVFIQTSIICSVRFLYIFHIVIYIYFEITSNILVESVYILMIAQHGFDGLLFFIIDRNLRLLVRNFFARYM